MSAPAAPLSIKHEQFCLAYVKSGDATASYALVAPDAKPANQKRTATNWLNNPNIIARIAELRGEIVQETKITVEDCISELEKDRRAAREDKNHSAAIKATENVARLLGYWVDRQDSRHTLTESDALKVVTQLFEKYAVPK